MTKWQCKAHGTETKNGCEGCFDAKRYNRNDIPNAFGRASQFIEKIGGGHEHFKYCKCGRRLPHLYKFEECGVCRSFKRMTGDLE